VIKLLYKPLGLAFGILGGLLASMLFDKLWRAVTGSADTPDATDPGAGWGEVVVAAALQGAVFAAVRAAVSRAGAKGYEKATGTWPT
jgi:hypothetical protein